MEMVRQEMINSVAVNISSATASSKTQVSHNNQYDLRSEYSSEVKTVAAKLPFISGISITEAETYWEKLYVKKEKRYYYKYHLKYPFPDATKQELVDEFERIDAEKESLLRQLQGKYENVSSVEEIGACLTDAKALSEYFFDSTRKTEAALLQKKFNDLYSHIIVQPIENVPGSYTFALLLRDKPVAVSRMPRLKSDYATNLSVARGYEDKTYTVNYSYKGCVPEEPNTVELLFYFGTRSLKHEFRFDVSTETVDIKFPGTIHITLAQEDPAKGMPFNIEMEVMADGEEKILVEEVSLRINELSHPLKVTGVGEMTVSQGRNHYRFSGISAGSFTGKKGALTDGYIKLKNLVNGNVISVRIQRPYKFSINDKL